MSWIANLTLAKKLFLLVLTAVACVVILQLASLASLKENLFEDRKLKTRDIVETASGVFQHYYQLEQKGSLSREQAQKQAIEIIKVMRYDGDQYLWINDMSPNMVMHPFKPELDGKDISSVADPNGVNLFVEMVSVVNRNGEGFVAYQWAHPGEQHPVDKISFVKGFTPWGWILGSGIYIDDVQSIYERNLYASLGFTVPMLLLVIVIAALISRSITAPVSMLNKIMCRVSSENDLTARADVRSRDEIGQMARSFNEMLESVSQSVRLVVSSAGEMLDSAERLYSITEKTDEGIQRQHRDIDQVATAMNEMSSTVDEVARNTSATSSATTDTRSEASTGHNIVKTAAEAITQLADEVDSAASVVLTLEDASNNIGSILDVIRGISEQTNLLALNAAIEAARAGEQGRGFAVVADEVRTLAMKTQSSVEETETIIRQIQEGTHNAVNTMSSSKDRAASSVKQMTEVSDSLKSISSSIETIQGMSLQIATAAEEQSVVAQDMNKNICDISSIAEMTADASKETRDASRKLAELSEQLKVEIAKFNIG